MKKIILAILDGVGYRNEEKGNAFKQAKKPNFEYLLNEYNSSFLEASQEYVGLPEGQMGNSEVGHLNIGAGRVVYQPLQLINKNINDKRFFENRELKNLVNHVKSNDSKLHVMGLFSDGGVHSHINHFIAALELAKQNNIEKVYFHLITDGRDTSPTSSRSYIKLLEEKISLNKLGSISTICGRYYAMDRDNNFERTKKAYDLYVNNLGKKYNNSFLAIEDNYKNNITDEFIEPSLIDENGNISDNDGILIMNFRPDRLTQLFSAISNKNFNDFENKKFNNIKLVTMMPVSEKIISTNAFNLEKLENTFGEYISKYNIKQLRIAETEKYAHVTYFFDGGIEKETPLCDRILIPSPKVATYDLKPEMSCNEITVQLLENMNKYDVIILNYANGDMVGHTGNMSAAIKAIETVDYNLGLLYKKAKELDFTLLITADHGNCEYMLDDNDKIVTSHTINKVYFIVCDKKYNLKDGKLGDIAPTMLKIMDIPIPKEMDGNILI